MVSLTMLVPLALAGGHAEVSLGLLPMSGLLGAADIPGLVRFEVGAEAPFGQVHGLVELSSFNASAYDDTGQSNMRTPGDGSLFQLGANYRKPWALGRFFVAVGGDLCFTRFSSPVLEAARAEYEADFGVTATGFESLGGSLTANGSFGWEVVPEVATLQVTAGIGYATNPGLGLLIPLRIGAAARF